MPGHLQIFNLKVLSLCLYFLSVYSYFLSIFNLCKVSLHFGDADVCFQYYCYSRKNYDPWLVPCVVAALCQTGILL